MDRMRMVSIEGGSLVMRWRHEEGLQLGVWRLVLGFGGLVWDDDTIVARFRCGSGI